MPSLRDIRQRVIAVNSIQKITKAMKMVAVVKLHRAQDAIVSARPYANGVKNMLDQLTNEIDVSSNELFLSRPIKRVVVIVVTADRGLCGVFNTNIVKMAETHIRTNYPQLLDNGNIRMICIGKKGFDYFSRRNYKIVSKHIGIFMSLKFLNAKIIVSEFVQGFLKGEYDCVNVIFNEFKSITQQRLVCEQLLPIPVFKTSTAGSITKFSSLTGSIYEPSSEEILASLVPRHLNFQMWRILLESNAAEQAARMVAMDNASTNAGELISDLQLSYNKTRQAVITKELLEIVSGVEILKKAG